MQTDSRKLKSTSIQSNDSCSVCKDLLVHLRQFFESCSTTQRQIQITEWLTVDEVAKELKISKSIVYRLIRNEELEAINIVDTNGSIPQRGHYRINRKCLNKFVENKKVKSISKNYQYKSRPTKYPKVKNHLGI